MANGGDFSQTRGNYAVLSPSRGSTDLMETFLRDQYQSGLDFNGAVRTAVDAWAVGHLAVGNTEMQGVPSREETDKHRQDQLATNGIEAAVLERGGRSTIRYRSLADEQVRPILTS
jgi:hypothetical protein